MIDIYLKQVAEGDTVMNKKHFDGLFNSSSEKRYKSFLNTSADSGEVWLLSAPDGYATFENGNNGIFILVWPNREFCEYFKQEDETPEAVEIHDFLKRAEKLENNIRFMVFPNDKDGYVVSREKIMFDIQNCLDEVE